MSPAFQKAAMPPCLLQLHPPSDYSLQRKDSQGESVAPKAKPGVVKGREGHQGVSPNNEGDLRFSKVRFQE